MFPAAKAQFDLAMAWSELALNTFAASTMIANSSAKLIAANAALERAAWPDRRAAGGLAASWALPAAAPGFADPVGFVMAASQTSMAFWAALLEPPKPASKPMPLWWTAYTDPLLPAKPTEQAARTYLLH
jgi:hypothetical protein